MTDNQNIADLPDWAQTVIRDLRSEAATNRRTAQEATAERDSLREQLHAKATAEALESVRSLMADPEDLARFVDAAELVGDDGAPDAAKYTEAAKKLVESKPHLAPRGKDFGAPVGGAGRSGNGVGGARPRAERHDTDAQIQAGQQDFINAVRGS
ncbi:MAG: hypothetical protein GX610_09420 [Rhodococcus sp.]|nr:hypothetical protein [Rhodococcus sp. (in: high G+C Gram-positive bacteria)]